jgi:hypothetical protein
MLKVSENPESSIQMWLVRAGHVLTENLNRIGNVRPCDGQID